MEYWSRGVLGLNSSLHYSTTPVLYPYHEAHRSRWGLFNRLLKYSRQPAFMNVMLPEFRGAKLRTAVAFTQHSLFVAS